MIDEEEAEAAMKFIDDLFNEERPVEMVRPIKTRYKIKAGADLFSVAVLKKGDKFHFGVIAGDEFIESKTTKPVSSQKKIQPVLTKLLRKGKILK